MRDQRGLTPQSPEEIDTNGAFLRITLHIGERGRPALGNACAKLLGNGCGERLMGIQASDRRSDGAELGGNTHAADPGRFLLPRTQNGGDRQYSARLSEAFTKRRSSGLENSSPEPTPIAKALRSPHRQLFQTGSKIMGTCVQRGIAPVAVELGKEALPTLSH